MIKTKQNKTKLSSSNSTIWLTNDSHTLIGWIFLFLSVFFTGTEGTEENTTYTPTPSPNSPSALKYPLIVLRLLPSTSLLTA